MPVKWKSLRLNIKENEAYITLGTPTEVLSETGRRTCYYGPMKDYGFLSIVINSL